MADVFPIIAQLIHELYEEDGEFVKYREIRQALLAHDEGRTHIERAVEQKGHWAEDWASWMRAWFGAAITDNRSSYQDDFERKRIEGRWAYRPVKG